MILLSVISRCRVEVGWILCSGFWIQVEIRLLFSLPVCGFFVCTAGSFLRGTGLSVKAGGAGRYEPGFGEGNTKCKE